MSIAFVIQKDSKDDIPHHFDASCVMYGCREVEQKYKLISYEDLCKGKVDHLLLKSAFTGSVEFMKEVFNRIKIKTPSVPRNCERKCKETTLKMLSKSLKKLNVLYLLNQKI